MSKLKKIINHLLHDYLDSYIQEYVNTKLLRQYFVFGDTKRLKIAKTSQVNNALFNLSSGEIILEDYVFFGHNVTILTGTHDYQKFNHERQTSVPLSGRNVIIRQGVWVASNATIIAPCVIGQHSVVAAGSLVNKDIPPYTIVAGVPAKVIKKIVHNPIEAINNGLLT